MYSQAEQNQSQLNEAQNIAESSSVLTNFMQPQNPNQPAVPKLEDFLGNSSSMMRYSDSQTETQDSSLTQIYDHHSSTYFSDQQDPKTIPGF